MDNGVNNKLEKKEDKMEKENKKEKEKSKNSKKKVIAIVIGILLLLVVVLALCIKFNMKGITNIIPGNDSKKNGSTQINVDLSKCINNKSAVFDGINSQTDMGVEIVTTSDKANIKIDWPRFGPNSFASSWSDDSIEYKVDKLSKKVKSGFVGGIGQDITSTTLFYLMEDGTVEYTELYKTNKDVSGNSYWSINYSYATVDGKISSTYFESQGKVKNVEGVVNLYATTACGKDGIGCHTTVIGVKNDGSFYDLGYEIVNSKEEETKPVTSSKCINNSSINVKSTQSPSNMGLSFVNNAVNQKVELAIDWPKFGPNSFASTYSDKTENYDINTDKNIKMGYVGELGQDVTGTTLFYLMEDGTVEYTRLYKLSQDFHGEYYYGMNYSYANGRTYFKSEGSISGVKDITEFTTATVCGQSGVGCYLTVLAKKANGDFYDLGYEINKVKDEVKPLDITKCINNKSINIKSTKNQAENIGLNLVYDSISEQAQLKIDWPKFGPNSFASTYSDKTLDYGIDTNNRKVKVGYVGQIGQDVTGTTLFYLMEDGTVEYTKLFKNEKDSSGNSYYTINYSYAYVTGGAIGATYFKSQGAISGVNNVVKFYIATTCNSSGTGCQLTTLAQKKDGTFYDLGYEVKKLG